MDIRLTLTTCRIGSPDDTDKDTEKLGRVVVCIRWNALDDNNVFEVNKLEDITQE